MPGDGVCLAAAVEFVIAAAAWRDVTPDLNLTLQGYARSQLGMQQLLAILRTVRFDGDRNGAALPGDD